MTAILRHRAVLLVALAAISLVTAGCVSFTGTKVIEGEAPPGAQFVVEIECVHEEEDVVFQATMTFTENSPVLTVNQLFPDETPPGETVCTIVETDNAGASSVEYQCGGHSITAVDAAALLDAAGLGGPGMSAPNLGDNGPTTATCTEFPDHLEWLIFMAEGTEEGEGDSRVHMEFTVINTFPEPETPTTAAPATAAPPAPAAAPAAPPAAAPVVAQPTFTG